MPKPGEAALELRHAICAYDRQPALSGVDLRIEPGEFLGVIGPNGAGKSTLLRAMSGTLPLSGGEARLYGRRLGEYRRREIARLLAVVPAPGMPVFAFTAREHVAMGRTPYLGHLQPDRPQDAEAVERALAAMDATHLAERMVTELSAGEWQRVSIAQSLAQEAHILLLDEPTAFLDLRHQREISELLARLNAEQDLTLVWVSHDLNLAAEYCARLVVLAEGRVRATGPPEAVLTEPLIAEVYGAPVQVDQGPGGRPRVTLLSERALEAQS